MEKFKVIKPSDGDCIIVLAGTTLYCGYYEFTNHHTYPHVLSDTNKERFVSLDDNALWIKSEIDLGAARRIILDIANPYLLNYLERISG